MIPWDAEYRDTDGPDDFQGFIQVPGCIDEVPGKTDEFGMLIPYGGNNLFGVPEVAAMMQVGYVYEPAWRGSTGQGEPGHLQPTGFKFHGIGEGDTGYSGKS